MFRNVITTTKTENFFHLQVIDLLEKKTNLDEHRFKKITYFWGM